VTRAIGVIRTAMKSEDVIATLREHESALRARGVRHAALFGSRARGDYRPDSDIDILIEIEPDTITDIFSYAGLKRHIADLFPERVDVVNREALKPALRSAAVAEAVYAF
jgi:predicted nucleotidyltransferase